MIEKYSHRKIPWLQPEQETHTWPSPRRGRRKCLQPQTWPSTGQCRQEHHLHPQEPSSSSSRMTPPAAPPPRGTAKFPIWPWTGDPWSGISRARHWFCQHWSFSCKLTVLNWKTQVGKGFFGLKFCDFGGGIEKLCHFGRWVLGETQWSKLFCKEGED